MTKEKRTVSNRERSEKEEGRGDLVEAATKGCGLDVVTRVWPRVMGKEGT